MSLLRARHPVGFVLAVVLLIGLGACGGEPTPKVTVSGYLHAGPMCPVESIPPDPACADRAVEGAVILVRNSAGVVIAEPRSEADGTFRVDLAAGTYTLLPQPVEGLMGTAPEQEVVVGATPVTGLDFAYDTGIR
ncbi:MAG TPA: hypothetical protein DCY40_02910 [Actinobacteria bacterium]|nr:hypothetical protein [Actinomycetota bacterium]